MTAFIIEPKDYLVASEARGLASGQLNFFDIDEPSLKAVLNGPSSGTTMLQAFYLNVTDDVDTAAALFTNMEDGAMLQVTDGGSKQGEQAVFPNVANFHSHAVVSFIPRTFSDCQIRTYQDRRAT